MRVPGLFYVSWGGTAIRQWGAGNFPVLSIRNGRSRDIVSCRAPTTDNGNNEHEVSEFHIEDGSFLRLKTLSLGYTLPANVMSKLHLSNARVYFQAQNVFTITSYTGADPEGLGYPYAMPRQYTFGIQFGF